MVENDRPRSKIPGLLSKIKVSFILSIAMSFI
jgi:hypothetical protein